MRNGGALGCLLLSVAAIAWQDAQYFFTSALPCRTGSWEQPRIESASIDTKSGRIVHGSRFIANSLFAKFWRAGRDSNP